MIKFNVRLKYKLKGQNCCSNYSHETKIKNKKIKKFKKI